MNATIRYEMDRETQDGRPNQTELVKRIAEAVPNDGVLEPLKGMYLRRASRTGELLHGVSEPSFCVIAQGRKEVLLGETVLRYDPAHYLLATVELPIVSHVVEASSERPYLSIRIGLDAALVSSVLVEAGYVAVRNRSEARAIDVSPLDPDLLDATVRLTRLIGSPADGRILQPLITREIVYRLLMGQQGMRLRHLTLSATHVDSITTAVQRLHRNFNQPLRIETLARDVGMSVSAFHYHFKAVTAMSPLQFQKQLRLQEARRILLGEDLDAASAGLRVGYEDPSQFTREYKRQFGEPPMRDVERLRQAHTIATA